MFYYDKSSFSILLTYLLSKLKHLHHLYSNNTYHKVGAALIVGMVGIICKLDTKQKIFAT